MFKNIARILRWALALGGVALGIRLLFVLESAYEDLDNSIPVPKDKMGEIQENGASVMVSYENGEYVYDLIRPEPTEGNA